MISALTLHQPWASLIAAGAKPYETRQWRAPDRLLDTRIAIHAGQRRPALDADDPVQRPIATALGADWQSRVPYGALVCTVRLDACHQVRAVVDVTTVLLSDDSILEIDPFGDYTPGRWLWRLADIKPLTIPIPARGRQGVWFWQPPQTDRA